MKILLLFIVLAAALTDLERYNKIKAGIESIAGSNQITSISEKEAMIQLLRKSIGDLEYLELTYGRIQPNLVK